MNNRRDGIIKEVAQVDALVKDPSKINRLGKTHRTPCKGNCGRTVWGDYCRKCRRANIRRARKSGAKS